MDITSQLITEFSLQPFQVTNTLALFDEDATVPFIARYRKEMTGSLDENQIRDLGHRYTYYKELDARRVAIIESITEQGKLTPELTAKINATLSKTELEDLYLPFKPKRTTRAIKAREAGLEPLSQWVLECDDPAADMVAKASGFINEEKGITSAQKALQGASDIIAEMLSDDADVRKWMRELAWAEGFMVSEVRKEFKEQKSKFEMYYNFREMVKTLPSHRILAMLRGEREDVLRLNLELVEEKVTGWLSARMIKHPQSATAGLIQSAVKDSLSRLLAPATETEVRNELREKGEAEAFVVFGDNLSALLLSPPAGHKAVLAMDPGFRTGCKIVALDATGKFLEYQTIFPHQPHNKTAEAKKIILGMIKTHGIELIAVGNGTAARETELFARDLLGDIEGTVKPTCLIVSESGASVYSASEIAQQEFPDFDLTIRGAISIGRRLQDPLSELVKIDPKAIGVGQYQHDVNQTKLKDRLEEVVESCVNQVGVDVNTASVELLKYLSGLNRLVAGKIVAYRNANGVFTSRDAIKKVSGIGEKVFLQSAGFLRVPQSVNPLDNSAVHPERYPVVMSMAEKLGTPIQQLVGDKDALKRIDPQQFVTGDVGLPTITDIIHELEKPGRDPRATFTYAAFSDHVKEISDLAEGMMLEGVVTNVTNFGAFVDIGVHQDGLVHISELADRYVEDPKTVVKAGQVVKVRVMKVDPQLKRIALSMKTNPTPVSTAKPEPGAIPAKRPAGSVPSAGIKQSNAPGTPKKLMTVKPKFNVRSFM